MRSWAWVGTRAATLPLGGCDDDTARPGGVDGRWRPPGVREPLTETTSQPRTSCSCGGAGGRLFAPAHDVAGLREISAAAPGRGVEGESQSRSPIGTQTVTLA